MLYHVRLVVLARSRLGDVRDTEEQRNNIRCNNITVVYMSIYKTRLKDWIHCARVHALLCATVLLNVPTQLQHFV